MFLGACLVGGWFASIFGNGYLMGRFDLVREGENRNFLLGWSVLIGPAITVIFLAMMFVQYGGHRRALAREQLRQRQIEEMDQQRLLREAGFDAG